MKHKTPIVVVGMAGVFPGASNLDKFWQNIIHKVDTTCEVPENRWIVKPDAMINPEPAPDKAFSKRACLIHDFSFNPEGIEIAPNLLSNLDPLYHIVLSAGQRAFSGCNIESINKDRIGVILAAIALPTDTSSAFCREILGQSFEKKLFPEGRRPKAEHGITPEKCLGARVTSLPGSILAKGLGLRGGSFTLDAACASSIYAIKLACDELHAGRADAMLAGGVSRPECLYTQVGFSQLRALSPSGRCSPFDKRADGLVVGEGAGIFVLKRLDDALRDNDTIYGVIRGIGLSNDIRGNLLAPDTRGQVRAMYSAYEAAGWSPHDVDLIECHGAGTPVGDTTELRSLRTVWGETGWTFEQYPIGSIKSMIGHLLTGAGAAGMIKTLLAMHHKILPPSLNFRQASPKSPLNNSPFRVQTEPEEWRQNNRPRRAAVSAFGFGGINAHLLFEEWQESKVQHSAFSIPSSAFSIQHSSSPIAIVGMETLFGALPSLKSFQEAVFRGESAIRKRPKHRWKGADDIADAYLEGRASSGGYMEQLSIHIGEFHIPPNEIQDILPQQLLMLKAAAGAMKDAGIDLRDQEERHRMGAIIGIEFDLEATNFHLRWNLYNQVQHWKKHLRLNDTEAAEWLESLRDACGPPLTPARTVGALGGIVASRVAREFRFGGPSFGVSGEETSGVKALEIGVKFLQQHTVDTVLVGAVELAGDVRNVIIGNTLHHFTKANKIRPFDKSADGTLPGEGAAALVLKRVDDAVKDGDKIYAVIKGIGGANGKSAYIRSLNQAVTDADEEPSSIHFIETHGSGVPLEDRMETIALHEFFPRKTEPYAIGSVKPTIGHSGAVAGLASLIKAALCLHHEKIPPLNNFVEPAESLWNENKFHFPLSPIPWIKNQQGSPRRAIIAAMAGDGNCSHVIIERFEDVKPDIQNKKLQENRYAESSSPHSEMVTVMIGGKAPLPSLPALSLLSPNTVETISNNSHPADLTPDPFPEGKGRRSSPFPPPSLQGRGAGGVRLGELNSQALLGEFRGGGDVFRELIQPMTQTIKSTADAHKAFLAFSNELTKNFGKTFALQTQLLEYGIRNPKLSENASVMPQPVSSPTPPAFSRDLCMEFAVGSLAKVLGREFAVVDTYNVRVRLPDEPLMLVDRIISVEGKKGSLGSGRVVTEHDVLPGAWYLDGNRAPVCISVEAGQADLFLCSYLGIDLAVKGQRAYRLLDATVKFHRGLPQPGDVIRYEIEIDKFIRQGETWLFFFHFEGFIGNEHLISMTNGCAGFFTDEEIQNSGGIILTDKDTSPFTGKKPDDWTDLVPVEVETYNEQQVTSLRKGDLAACFGPLFEGIQLAESIRLPGGRMKLIDRILLLDPKGGRYGLGIIRGEADVHPDDWFLTCHFMDDMVMPGTLMYECCAHTLRIFLQRIGWVIDKPGVCYEPVIGVESILKCRGPVTPKTQKVIYEIEIREIGYSPEPYAIADALMYADGRRIVKFNDMTLKMTGVRREEIESFWYKKTSDSRPKTEDGRQKGKKAIYDRKKILEFAIGKPSEAFGEPYRVFDNDRVIARLPGPPYSFMDRVTHVEPAPWVLKPGGWIESEYDVPHDAWYFRADRTGSMPFCILLEIGLQPCGWLAAYIGSALKSKNNLKFRNLGGKAVLHSSLDASLITYDASHPLTMRSRLTQVSEAGDMIIEHFDMQILQNGKMIYDGNTYFGFFTKEALSQQIGIRGADKEAYIPKPDELKRGLTYRFKDESPLFPDDPNLTSIHGLAMPSKALRMIDEIDCYIPDGGPFELGFIRGVKWVNPDEWFFKAHFYQDPVCPGSLGIESFLQLIKYIALDRWKHLASTYKFEMITKKEHEWTYRGQIIQRNKKIEVEAVVTDIQDEPVPTIKANGYLKVDGLYIYKMENFGFRLVSD